jgi:multidrug efflux pump subunit AcrB
VKIERLVRGLPGLLVAFAGILSMTVSGFVLMAMCVYWLKRAAWPDWSPIALGYEPFQTRMLGFNQIINWVYDRQMVWILLIGGALCAFVGSYLVDQATQSMAKEE